MLQPMLGRWVDSTGRPPRPASRAARRSRPVTGLPLPGRLSSRWPRHTRRPAWSNTKKSDACVPGATMVDSVRAMAIQLDAEQPRDRQVFIEVVPVDANAFADQTPMRPLFRSRASELRKPVQRRADFAPVRKLDVQALF